MSSRIQLSFIDPIGFWLEIERVRSALAMSLLVRNRCGRGKAQPPLTDFRPTKMNAGLGGCHRLDAHGTRKRHSDKDKFMVRLSCFKFA